MSISISSLPAASALTGNELIEISQLSPSIRISASTISAIASDNSFNDSAAGFIASGFNIGDRVNVTGFVITANNLLSGVIVSLTANKMIIGGIEGDAITDATSGNSVVITKWVSRRANTSDLGEVLNTPNQSNFPIVVGSPTVIDSGKGITLTGAASSAQIRAILKSPPAGNFTVTVKMQGSWGLNFNGAGIVFRDSSNRFSVAGGVNVSGTFTEIANFTNATLFSAGAASTTLDNANWPEWYRASFNSTSGAITASISWDGVNWWETGTSTFLTSINAVGIGIAHRSSTRSIRAIFTSYQET